MLAILINSIIISIFAAHYLLFNLNIFLKYGDGKNEAADCYPRDVAFPRAY